MLYGIYEMQTDEFEHPNVVFPTVSKFPKGPSRKTVLRSAFAAAVAVATVLNAKADCTQPLKSALQDPSANFTLYKVPFTLTLLAPIKMPLLIIRVGVAGIGAARPILEAATRQVTSTARKVVSNFMGFPVLELDVRATLWSLR